jgi:tyrosine-protein kinase Etk/Wzc
MTTDHSSNMARNGASDDGVGQQRAQITLLDYLELVWQWRRTLVIFVLCVTVVAGIVSLLLPKWYKSTASVLPARTQGMMGGMGALSQLLKDVTPGSASKLGGSQSSSYSYLAILNSRRAAEDMIRRFDLMKEYDIDDNSMEKAIKEFYDNFNFEVTDDGAIVINIFDRDSVRAADMANHMVQILNEVSVELGTGEARKNREFLENRVAENRRQLSAAEDSLKRYQEVHGMLLLGDDAKSAAASIGALYATKVKADVELSVLQQTSGRENVAYQQLQLQRDALEKKLSTFPQLGMESFRRFRDVVIQQKIMEFLVPLYEQARLEEHKDLPVMVVLDKAVPAEKKERPQRTVIVAAAFLSSLVIALIVSFLLAHVRLLKVTEHERYQAWVSVFKRKTRRSVEA